jgi:hypothetical protein
VLYHHRVVIIYVVESGVRRMLVSSEYCLLSLRLVLLEVSEVVEVIEESYIVATGHYIVRTVVGNSVVHSVSTYSIVRDD